MRPELLRAVFFRITNPLQLIWLNYSYKLVKMYACLSVCVWMLTNVAQIVHVDLTAAHRNNNFACTDLAY